MLINGGFCHLKTGFQLHHCLLLKQYDCVCIAIRYSVYTLHKRAKVKVKLHVKPNKALDENSPLSYVASIVIWDHTVLPATRYK